MSKFLLVLLFVAVALVHGYSVTQQHQSNRRAALLAIPSAVLSLAPAVCMADDNQISIPPTTANFQRYPQIRFIAALGDPSSSSGTGADQWGLWRDDPGPRGVFLRDYDRKLAKTGVAPAGWPFQKDDWWLEEHGLIMSTPESLPRKKYDKNTKQVLPYKRYVVTGDREVTTVLTVFDNGQWELGKGTLYDVTHLPCRSARYTPVGGAGDSSCLPSGADGKNFPVKPGASMPPVSGCNKQDYAVLFVLGEEV
jgi:hypothetical protein